MAQDGNEKADAMMAERMAELRQPWKECDEACESPIERLMFWALARHLDLDSADGIMPPIWIPHSDHAGSCAVASNRHIGVDVAIQVPFVLGSSKYRADLVISVVGAGRLHRVVVECDGHDFHERTKEQAQRDRARDRAFAEAGLKVVRFTGSEIYRHPDRCAEEAFRVLAADVARSNEASVHA